MRPSFVRALAYEARDVARTLRHELSPAGSGPVVVSGVLAEQLAKELRIDADPGAVVVVGGSSPGDAEVLVHVVAGIPTEEDEKLVRTADERGIPTVIVQLWPQADWTRPFVLSPFVVECRAGEGFPMGEIADRIVDASDRAPVLAARIPALQASVARSLVRLAVIRSAVLSGVGTQKGAVRPLLALEQTRMLARLHTAEAGTGADRLPVVAGGAALALAWGFAFRSAARAARSLLPQPVADAAVAAAGTWALAKACRAAGARFPAP